MRSAHKLATICVLAAAGTILGTAAIAAAQSRPSSQERQERVIVREQRGDAAPKVQVFREGGDEDGKVQVKVFVDKDGDDDGDDDDRADGRKHQKQMHRDIQKHMEVLHGQMGKLQDHMNVLRERGASAGHAKGEVCPSCGRPLDDDGPAQGKAKTFKKTIRLGEGGPGAQGWAQAFDGQNWQAFGQGFGEGGGPGQGHAFGKAIVVGPDGQRKEFNFGDGQAGGGSWGGPGEPKVQIRRFGPGGAAGGGGGAGHPKIETHVDGKVIVIGPDGQRRQFNLGDGPKAKGGAFGPGKGPQIFEFRDGDGNQPHLFMHAPGDDQEDGPAQRRIEIRRGPGMNVI